MTHPECCRHLELLLMVLKSVWEVSRRLFRDVLIGRKLLSMTPGHNDSYWMHINFKPLFSPCTTITLNVSITAKQYGSNSSNVKQYTCLIVTGNKKSGYCLHDNLCVCLMFYRWYHG